MEQFREINLKFDHAAHATFSTVSRFGFFIHKCRHKHTTLRSQSFHLVSLNCSNGVARCWSFASPISHVTKSCHIAEQSTKAKDDRPVSMQPPMAAKAMIRCPASTPDSRSNCSQNGWWSGSNKVSCVTNSLAWRKRLSIKASLWAGTNGAGTCCGIPITKGRWTAGRCATFMSWEPPTVLPTLIMAHTFNLVNSSWSIECRVPRVMFHSVGKSWSQAVLTTGPATARFEVLRAGF